MPTNAAIGSADAQYLRDAASARKACVAACRAEFTAVARSFWLVPELIPQPARDDIAVLYCVCRRLDDDVDEAATRAAAAAALARWRAELEGRAAPRPLVAAFLARVPETRLPLDCLGHLLDGMAFDLESVRIADDAELLRYAYRVSSAVGLLLAPLLGVTASDAPARIVDLGLALQLSNVLLGVRGDARRGRVYLPRARLAAAGLTPGDVLANPGDRRLLPVLEGLAQLADRYYRSAADGAATWPLRYRHGIILLARVYADLGRRAARGESAPSSPASLPRRTQFLRLGQLFATAWHPKTLGLVAARAHEAALHAAIAGWPGARRAAPVHEPITRS